MESRNRRKYYRAKIVLPVSWEVLPMEEKDLVAKGLGATLIKKGRLKNPIDECLAQAEPGTEAQRVYQCLQLINNKLSFIIDHLMTAGGDRRPLDDVIEISGSGLKFVTDEELSTGDLLRMHLVMPESTHYQTELLAEVVRVETLERGHLIAAGIVAIDEDSRDAIVQAVFRQQRQEIRHGRDETGGETP